MQTLWAQVQGESEVGEQGTRIRSNEAFLLTLFAGLFLLSGFGETIRIAEAIGALLLGLVLAETEHAERIENLIAPFRDSKGRFSGDRATR